MRFDDADAVVREALGSRFTAAVLRVEQGGRVVFERAYGFTDASPGCAPVSVSTRFDIASLTKPFVASMVLREVAAGRLSLDGSLLGVVPEWGGCEQESITPRLLLAHTAGMQSGADYRLLLNDSVEHYALTQPLLAAPRERVVYSDLGFIALGAVVERVTRRSLPALMAAMTAELQVATTAYRPRREELPFIPATEQDSWRGRLRGVVHDEKAYLLNGVAGHAGLFATARDVAALTEAFLGPACCRTTTLLPPSLACEAITEQAPDVTLRRGLGWALKTRDDNSCGTRMSSATFGHTGFVGTCVWADPTRDAQIVLLTNAVYFGRSSLLSVRTAVCDAVIARLDG